jgi:hypothetical protein
MSRRSASIGETRRDEKTISRQPNAFDNEGGGFSGMPGVRQTEFVFPKVEEVLLRQVSVETLVPLTSTYNGSEDRCVYCGDWFECRDHLVPRSFMRVYRDYRKSETVHCCALCNQLAGDYVAYSVGEKAVYLIDRYERKFKKWLELPAWHRTEVNELRFTLKRRIAINEAFRRLITAKLRNLDLVSLGFKPIPIERRICQL